MSRKGSERVNEMELFHGSSFTAPEEIYKSEEGFDMRFSRQGMWGNLQRVQNILVVMLMEIQSIHYCYIAGATLVTIMLSRCFLLNS